ncbi:MAG TPA: DNA primase [Candidatus Paceibacterota bacterium]
MSTHVQDIKERLGIVEVLSSYIKLEKSGANYKARCPFHNEKTPSFYVSPERNSFYCFGCGEKGDIFSFVEKFEGLDFSGALKVLADRAGVSLARPGANKDNRKEILYEILEAATVFYEETLKKDAAAKAYIVGRGLTEKTIEHFRVGYAPADWRQLRSYLRTKGYRDADVEAVGLIKRTDKPGGDPFYDVFRGRIMFPICDTSGRVVAYSGRIVVSDDKSPKYLNSPETALYSKSKTLYGLDKAKQDIRKRDYVLLVEGQMDCVMLHQAGFTNTVAASGTAFTEDDGPSSGLGLIMRLTDNIVIAFDSDAAGQKAAKRIVPAISLMTAISLGMNIKIIDIKGGKDPADIVKEDPKNWVKAMESKKHFIDFLVDSFVDKESSPTEARKLINQDIFPFVRRIPADTQRFQAIKTVAEKLAISEDALWKDLQAYVKLNPEKAAMAQASPQPKKVERIESIERKVLGIMHSKKYYGGDEAKKKALYAIVGPERAKAFEALPQLEIESLSLEAEVTHGDGSVDKEYQLLMLHLESEYAKRSLEEKMALLHRLEKGKGDIGGLMQEIQVLSKRIQEIKALTEKI